MHVLGALSGIETISLRYFNVFGPGQDPNGEYAAVVARFITAALAKTQPTIYGDGRQSRDFIHVSNIVSANLAAAEAANVTGLTFNVGSGRDETLLELLVAIESVVDRVVTPRFESGRAGDVRASRADISRAARDLGYVVETDLAAGIADTVASYRVALSCAHGRGLLGLNGWMRIFRHYISGVSLAWLAGDILIVLVAYWAIESWMTSARDVAVTPGILLAGVTTLLFYIGELYGHRLPMGRREIIARILICQLGVAVFAAATGFVFPRCSLTGPGFSRRWPHAALIAWRLAWLSPWATVRTGSVRARRRNRSHRRCGCGARRDQRSPIPPRGLCRRQSVESAQWSSRPWRGRGAASDRG